MSFFNSFLFFIFVLRERRRGGAGA
jgi:hypothetical protein